MSHISQVFILFKCGFCVQNEKKNDIMGQIKTTSQQGATNYDKTSTKKKNFCVIKHFSSKMKHL